MRKILFTVVFLSSLSAAFATDPEAAMSALPRLPSTFRPLTPVGNAHIVGRVGRIIRGASPIGHERLLKQIGFTDVLIFKNSVKGENQQEIQSLLAAGFARNRITEIPFLWKDIPSPDYGCKQVVLGLQKLREVALDRSRAMFFHCTVGEDRTGVLAASFRMIFDGWNADDAFKNEMCAHGYANGNPRKAEHVARAIHFNVTPVFAKVAALAESGHLNFKNLNPALCEVRVSREMYQRMRELSTYVCRTGPASSIQ